MNTLKIISTLLGLQGIILSVILFIKKQTNIRAKRLLSLNILSFSLVLMMHNVANSMPDFSGKRFMPGLLFILLFGPGFYYYVKALIHSKDSSLSMLPHTIPFLCALLIYIPVMTLINQPESYVKITLFISLISVIHITIYIILSITAIKQYSKDILNNFSDIEKLNVQWLYFLSYVYIFAWVIFLIIRIFFPGTEYNDYFWLLICIIIYIIGIFTLKQPEIVLGRYRDDIIEIKKETKYEKSGLSGEQRDEYIEKIKNDFERNKSYLDCDITLKSLSDKLSISTHHLSQVINEKLADNFYDLINTYRVQEAKEKLQDKGNSQLTILDIALETGFNSLSTFNAAFKKITGITPSIYRLKFK